MTATEKAEAVRDYAAQTIGTSQYHGGIGITFTDGARFMAETCGAFWLLDAIGSHQIRPDVRREPFQVWTLKPHGSNGALLECRTDSEPHGSRLVSQEIPFTDFPRELMPFRLWNEGGVVLLPEEH